MAMPKVLDWLDDLVAKVATNTTNIATNKANIAANKKSIDDHKKDDVRHWTTADRQNFNRVVHFKGYFTTIQALKTAYPTGQVGDYGIVGETDTVWLWDDTKNEWLNSTEQGIVISVNGRTGEVILTKTDVGLSNVDNTSDKNKPISDAQQEALDDKADRLQISASDADGSTLRAGIYYMFEPRTILGKEATEWTIIVGEYPDMMDFKPATQLWISWNGMSDNEQHIYMRHRDINNGTEFWSEFKELSTNIDISGLQTQITTNKNNIKINADDIDMLESDKADRRQITAVEANGFDLRAGIYECRESMTININGDSNNQYTSSHWSVIVGDALKNTGGYSQISQIWIEYRTSGSRIFYRSLRNGNIWGDFYEIITSKYLTNTEISRIKQYKGYFATKADLQTAYPTATDGDYAIVGNALYIWNSQSASWTEVSGSGGSGGTGKWSIKRYTPSHTSKFDTMTKIVPELSYLTQCDLYRQIEVEDTDDYILTDWGDDAQFYLLETYVKVYEATDLNINLQQMEFKTGINIYVNGRSIFSTADSSTEYAGDPYPVMHLDWGWNKIQILIYDMRESATFKLGERISTLGTCEMMDCYHNSETVIENAYVPLFGNSTIEGKIQVQGTVGITNKSYLKYNEEDNSLSFMFDDNMDM